MGGAHVIVKSPVVPAGNSQGMGRMDLARAFDATPRLLVDQTEILHTTGQTSRGPGIASPVFHIDKTRPGHVHDL